MACYAYNYTSFRSTCFCPEQIVNVLSGQIEIIDQ